MTRFVLCVLGLCLLLGGVGCAKKAALTPEQKEQLKSYVSTTPTKPQHPLDIRFGDDQVVLLGYDLDATEIEPGKPVKVTWHFKVNKPVGGQWKLFTHLADARNRSRINLDENGPLRALHQPAQWEAGTYIRDEQTISLPADWKSDRLTVYLGIWKGNDRLTVKGPSDKQNRARALSLPVKTKDVPIPELTANELPASDASGPAREPKKDKKAAAIKLDGKLDEEAWQKAQATSSFINTMNGEPAEPKVSARALWDAQNLYVAFEVTDDLLKSTFEKDDDHLWEQDCVEIMVDPDGDGKNYFELQVSPAGKAFDTRYDSRRVPKPFGHVDWNAGLKNGVELRGKLNDDEADQGYTAEIAIPWSAFAQGEPKHTPPKAGDSWRINFYVMDAREKGMRAVGWSAPLVGDFHVPNRFGKLTFAAAAPAPAPAQAAK